MYMRKVLVTGMAAASVLLIPTFAGADGGAPEHIQFEEAAHLIPALGETYDAAAALEISGDDASGEMVYSTFDESVAEVSEDGVITATGYGITTIVVSSAVDETVSASMDVAVFDLYGTYSGVKTIEAMGCDVAVDITLKEDGTYSYYRAPMEVALSGGGEMPELEEEGTYEMTGTEITFTGETLGEYTAVFRIEEENGCLAGKLPTGGAATEMELVKEAEEESTEEEGVSEEGAEETEEGTEK